MDFEPFQHHFWTFKIFELSVLISHFLVTFLVFLVNQKYTKKPCKNDHEHFIHENGAFLKRGVILVKK